MQHQTNTHIIIIVRNLEAVVQRCSIKKVFLKISQNLQDNTSARDSFLIKLQAWGFIKKRDSGTGVFLSILSNF